MKHSKRMKRLLVSRNLIANLLDIPFSLAVVNIKVLEGKEQSELPLKINNL